MAERGEWRHRQRAGQLLSFSGLRWGTITPTDFDLFIDFGGRAFVLGELKYRDAPISRGQELALERAVDTWTSAGVPTLGFIARHHVDIGEVPVADAEVVEIRWRGAWRRQMEPCTVASLIGRFHGYIAGENAA